jgi:DNA-binding XRE family transcriptional regulator
MTRGEIESAFYLELGRKLEAKRKQLKMSRQSLAVEIGVHRNTIFRWEIAEASMGIWHLLRLCDVLRCNHLLMLPGLEFTWGGELRSMTTERDPKRRIRYERDPPLAKTETADEFLDETRIHAS